MNSNNDLLNNLYSLYNQTYKSFLNNLSPSVIFNSFVRKLNILIDSELTYLITCKNNDKITIQAMSNNVIEPYNITLFENPTINFVHSTRIYKFNFDSKDIFFNDYFNNNIDYHLSIPIVFNNNIEGVIGFVNVTNDFYLSIKPFICLLGSLFYSFNNNIFNPIEEKEYNNKNDFIAYISHELRNPLQSILLSNSLLYSEINKIDSSNNKVLKLINTNINASNDMKKIIDDVLDLSKLENDELNISLEIIEINELIEVIQQKYNHICSSKNLNFIINVSNECPKTIYSDPCRVNQIISNLLSNAIKYSPKNSELILDIIYDSKKHGVKFSIIDNGPGIKQEDITMLFKKFSQTSNNFKFNVNSNGIGLYISQKIAKLLNGYISYKPNKSSSGSIFTLFIPIQLGMSCILFDNIKQKQNIYGNVLLVDDDESNLFLIKSMIQNINLTKNYVINVFTCSSGIDAVNFDKSNIDIIFMDINMDGMDGIEATKIIKNNGFKKNIIALTGNILAKNENHSLDLDDKTKFMLFDDIIIKPCDDKQLISVFNRYLN